MAEIMDEFDEPYKPNSMFCAQLSVEEYEDQTITETDKAIKQLIHHLEENPQEYGDVLKKKRKEEAEEAGWLSYAKVRTTFTVNSLIYIGSHNFVLVDQNIYHRLTYYGMLWSHLRGMKHSSYVQVV